MTREDMTAFYTRRVETMNRHDATALALHHTEEGTVQSPLSGGTAQGREAIERVYDSFIRAFPDVQLRQESLLIEENRAVLLLSLTGTDAGGLMGMPPTGRPFSMSMVFMDEFEGDLIARERRIYDFTGLLIQIGAIKAKPA